MPDFGPAEVTGFGQNQCWRNRTTLGGTFQGRCSKAVDPNDALGLCQDHIDEMRDLSEESPSFRTEDLDNPAVLC